MEGLGNSDVTKIKKRRRKEILFHQVAFSDNESLAALFEGMCPKSVKKTPSSRIRTSDLRITLEQLQSSALPTELSKEDVFLRREFV